MEWIEKALLTRLWITVESNQDDTTAFESVKGVLQYFHANVNKPLNPPAAHATQMVDSALSSVAPLLLILI